MGNLRERASAASCRAPGSTVTDRKVRHSNFGNRVTKRYGNIGKSEPANRNHIGICISIRTNPNHIRSFAAENGAGAKGEMGEGSEGSAASVSFGGSENNKPGSCCQTNHVGSRPQQDRGVPASPVGKVEGGAEEGGVEPREPAAVM